MNVPDPTHETTRIQQEILTALRGGATFSTAHKEGGTTIFWERGRFIRVDLGECPDRVEYTDEAAFLAFLRRFYEWETSRHSRPESSSELDRWKQILSLLREQTRNRRPAFGNSFKQWVLAFLIAILAVGGLVLLRGGPFWFHRQFTKPSLQAAPLNPPASPPQIRPSY